MNEPRPMPNLPTPLPSCPWCVQTDRVATLDPPTLHRNAPMAENAPTWPFHCGRCNLPFTGTEDEFIRNGPRRHEIREKAKKRNVPEGVR